MKKIFGVLNIVDIILIFVIIMAVIMGIYKFTASDDAPSRGTDNAVLTFVCESIPESVIKDIAEGQHAADHTTGASLGEVTSASVGGAMVYHPNSEGVLTLSGKPGYKAINIKTSVTGTKMPNGFMSDDALYLAGQSLMLRVGDALLPVYIAEIAYD